MQQTTEKMIRDAFSSYHPAVNFAYFAVVLLLNMTVMHPIYLLISLLCGAVYYGMLCRAKASPFGIGFLLIIALTAAIINPAFNHRGATVLCYFPSGNPLTLESLLYGAAAAVMLSATVLWFFCFSRVMTSDKFLYLFGKAVPALSLVLSMTLRFVPRLAAQYRQIMDAQKCLGRDITKGSLIKRMRCGVIAFSVLISWSMENAIETADSMRARGYGLPGRTAFSIFRFEKRDLDLLLWVLFCGAVLACGALTRCLHFSWYPVIRCEKTDLFALCVQAVYFALCATPIVLEMQEQRLFKQKLQKTF